MAAVASHSQGDLLLPNMIRVASCPTPGETSSTGPLVTPVAEYEPPSFGGPPPLPTLTGLSPTPPPRRRATPCALPRNASSDEGQTRAAAAFADAALRRVLEVIDRRRTPAQVRPILAAGLADSLLPATRAQNTTGAARLRRVRAQPVSAGGAEVAASYTRGDRVHAIACRVEQVTGAAGPRWQMVALHLG